MKKTNIFFVLQATITVLSFLLQGFAAVGIEKPKISDYEAKQVKNSLLRMAANPIQTCFKSWEVSNKQFVTGRINVEWEIQPNGSVKNANIIHSDIKDLDRCVLKSIKKIEFPSPPNRRPYYVAHKFTFKKQI
jgi:TonB family protein